MKLTLNKALNLADFHRKQGHLQKAEKMYQAILKTFPDNTVAKLALSNIATELEAKQHQLREVKLVEELRDLYLTKDMQKAVTAAEELILLSPDLPIAWSILGGAYLSLGNNVQAEIAFRKLKTLMPTDPYVANNFATALVANNKPHEAIEHFQTAIKYKADFLESHIGLANCLQTENRLSEAGTSIQSALELSPDDGRALNILANIKMKQGETGEAVNALQKAINSNVFSADAHRQLSMLIKYEPEHAHIKQVEEILANHKLTPHERCQMSYAYAKINEDIGDYEKAYHYYASAGQLRKEMIGYKIEGDIEYFSNIKKHYMEISKIRCADWNVDLDVSPIFIIGMPRSGTSLLEQIISNHSRVYAAGELHYVGQAGRQLVAKNMLDIDNLNILRNFYIKKIKNIGVGHEFVTDKMPHNFWYVGIIKTIFPYARIVNVKRDPGAVCWSNFQRYFPAPELGYSFDINDTVKHYQLYIDLMNFWHNAFPNEIYEVDYDQLTVNPEVHIRSLLNNLGLDWEDACLAPHKNQRVVLTASREQVKEKIYTGSSQAWRKFEPYLGGAFDVLYE